LGGVGAHAGVRSGRGMSSGSRLVSMVSKLYFGHGDSTTISGHSLSMDVLSQLGDGWSINDRHVDIYSYVVLVSQKKSR